MPTKPKPTFLAVLDGNPGKKTLNKREPQPKIKPPRMPHGMTKEAKAQWKKLLPELYSAKMVTAVDAEAFRMLCEEAARYFEAVHMLEKHGSIVKGRGGIPTPSPFVGIAQRAGTSFRMMLAEFGMTPSSRTKVEATEKQAGEFDGF